MNVRDCANTSGCCFGYFMMWVASLKERNDMLNMMRGERFHDDSSKEEAAVCGYLHLV